jgi:hypothetical protein
MNCIPNVTTNAGGIPYISSTNVTIGTESVDIALGFRRIQPVGYMTIFINDVIPSGTTTTLPVTLTLNGTTRSLTLPNGTPATVAELIGVNIFNVFNDRFKGILALMSRTTD